MYESTTTVIKEILKTVHFPTLTTDTWTAEMQTKTYLGVTIHYINNLKLTSATVEVTEIYESHTSVYIGNQLMDILNRWEINNEKVVAVVTDNAVNIVRAVYDVFGKQSMSHVLLTH